MYEITKAQLPICSWIPPHEIESGAIDQAVNAANHPHARQRVVLLPDVHHGYGVPIGSVVAFEGHVCPFAVGYDIGCGMVAIRTNIRVEDFDRARMTKVIMAHIRKYVPLGKGGRREKPLHNALPEIPDLPVPMVMRQIGSAPVQLGTLGGGNHFIEIQKGSDGYVWIMIHSGSRNLGWQVADHYMRVAKILNAPPGKGHIVPPSFDLETLPMDSEEGQAYIREMNWALEFALLNRKVMMDIAKEAVLLAYPNAKFDREINIHHNFAAEEEHGGETLWVHRKGATRAFAGMEGIIPGAQGAHSYIIRGLGNEESFQSCSHGAGRKMSRTKAVDTLDLAAEIAEMEALGVVHALRTDNDKAEAKGAYKDVIQVMAYQTDLVEIDTELFTLGVLKGPEEDKRRKKKKSAAERDMDVDLDAIA